MTEHTTAEERAEHAVEALHDAIESDKIPAPARRELAAALDHAARAAAILAHFVNEDRLVLRPPRASA